MKLLLHFINDKNIRYIGRYIVDISDIDDVRHDIDNRYSFDRKINKISIILGIYHRYIGFGPIYHGNIESMAHVRISLIFR